jgi:dTDP-4-dehydrorhamnose reductase
MGGDQHRRLCPRARGRAPAGRLLPDQHHRARAARRRLRPRGIPFVTFSSDLVFDGKLGRPYLEPDPTSPTCVYGESKAQAEDRVLAIDPQALIVRTSAFFGPWDPHNFPAPHGGRAEPRGGSACQRQCGGLADLRARPRPCDAGPAARWRARNLAPRQCRQHQLARACAEIAGRTNLSPKKIRDSGGERADTTLGTSRGQLLRPLTAALDDYVRYAETLPR